MPCTFVIEEIKRLSQEQGLRDQEIADVLGCSRATVNRVRNKHILKKANLKNRLDKTYVCGECKKEVVIRRRELRKYLCDDCLAKQVAPS